MAAPANEQQPPQPTFIDMTALSQSELYSLSLSCPSSSSTSLNPNISPVTIDRTIFNESAGSRRQTFSRPSSSHHHHHRHRLAGLLPKTTQNPNPDSPEDTVNDSDRIENYAIIKFLKKLLSSHPDFSQLDLIDFDSFTHLNDAINFNNNVNSNSNNDNNISHCNLQIRKRTRGRKPKVKIMSVLEGRERGIGFELVNRNGVVVDLDRLASLDDPYKDELKKRTEGLVSEEELLGFFRDLNGQWCSRRRKRRIVDANEFGDFLPIGWKLLLGLKRKEGKAWVYCRRYISPGGQQLVTCKEVSEYLQSFSMSYDAHQLKLHTSDNIHQVHRVASESRAGTSGKDEDQRQSSEHEKAVVLLGIENLELEEVQIQDLFECHKCNMTFDEKDTYLQHLLSFHQRTTRRYRLGSSVGDGVIVKDGKYECQFCHKVFHERRRYNGHVGIHVRNFVRGIEESPGSRMALEKRSESPPKDKLPTRISKMDALIEIAQNSIRETSSDPNGEAVGGFNSDKQNVAPNQELLGSVSDHELKSDSIQSEPDTENGMNDESQEAELHQQKTDRMIIDDRTEKIDGVSNFVDVMIDSSVKEQQGSIVKDLGGTDGTDNSAIEQDNGSKSHFFAPMSNQNVCSADSPMHLVDADIKIDEVDKAGSIEIELSFGSNNGLADDSIVQETGQQQFLTEDELQHSIQESHVSLSQSSHGISAPKVSLDKVENQFSSMDQRHDRISGFEELRLEDIEQLKFSFGTGQESISMPEVPINLEKYAEMEGSYGTSFQFESGVVIDAAGGQQLTVCVWCGVEFTLEAVETEMQSGSVGYMCPTCKSRISGQLNVLDGDCS